MTTRWTIGGRLAFGMGAIIALFLMSDLIVYWSAREANALGSGLRLCALLAGVAVGFLTLRGVTRPVRSLLAATQAPAADDLSRRVLPESDDELGRLAIAFNQMAKVLEVRDDGRGIEPADRESGRLLGLAAKHRTRATSIANAACPAAASRVFYQPRNARPCDAYVKIPAGLIYSRQ